jgi:hypothetical protein
MTNTTYIICVRIDSPERINNLDFCINFLQTNFSPKIILVEEDETSKVENRYTGIQYIFIKSLFPIFHRTRLLNKAVNELLDTPYFCLYDMDVFIDPEIYIQAVEHLKQYSVVYPFSGKFYDIPQKYNQNKALRSSDIIEQDKVLLNGDSLGGAVFFRTTDFIKGGMENEFFLGWGYEDNERYIRFGKLGFKIKRMDNPIYHFTHPRGMNSSGTNPNVWTNRAESEKIERMTKTELIRYVNQQFHWCKQRKILKISIIIPTYEMNGIGVTALQYNIGKILEQTFTDFEVIIADHSVNSDIENLISSYRDDRLTYLRNTTNRGNPCSNLNFAVAHATGSIIKPMFQDDYFYDKNALNVIHGLFLAGHKWVSVACNHSEDRINYYNDFYPSWNDNILYGINTMSSPSCIAYVRDNEVFWDEAFIWLLDCKLYWDLFRKYGLPYFEKQILVTNYSHPAQLGKTLTPRNKQLEVELMRREHGNK